MKKRILIAAYLPLSLTASFNNENNGNIVDAAPVPTPPPPTSIYIDQVAAYSSLPLCAQDQLSTIVRAQLSGCGDNMQLTSFACFCLDSRSEFASIISTAVEERCAASAAATATATETATWEAVWGKGRKKKRGKAGVEAEAEAREPINEVRRRRRQVIVASIPSPTAATQARRRAAARAAAVTSALDVFRSYCDKTTELTRFARQTQPPSTVTVTKVSGATSRSSSSTSSSSFSSAASSSQQPQPTLPVAAVVLPATIIPLAAIMGTFLYLCQRQRKQRKLLQQRRDVYEVDGDRQSRAGIADNDAGTFGYVAYPGYDNGTGRDTKGPRVGDVERMEMPASMAHAQELGANTESRAELDGGDVGRGEVAAGQPGSAR